MSAEPVILGFALALLLLLLEAVAVNLAVALTGIPFIT